MHMFFVTARVLANLQPDKGFDTMPPKKAFHAVPDLRGLVTGSGKVDDGADVKITTVANKVGAQPIRMENSHAR